MFLPAQPLPHLPNMKNMPFMACFSCSVGPMAFLTQQNTKNATYMVAFFMFASYPPPPASHSSPNPSPTRQV